MSPIGAASLYVWRSYPLPQDLVAPLLGAWRAVLSGMNAHPFKPLDIKEWCMATLTFTRTLAREQKRLLTQADKLKAHARELEAAAAALARALGEATTMLGSAGRRVSASGLRMARDEVSRRALAAVESARGRLVATSDVVKSVVEQAKPLLPTAAERAKLVTDVSATLTRFANKGVVRMQPGDGVKRDHRWAAVRGTTRSAAAGKAKKVARRTAARQ